MKLWRLPMRTIVLTAALTAALLLLAGPTAQADDDEQGNRTITRYEATATADDSGEMDVEIDLDFDFADKPGHGVFLTLITRQEIADDPDHYRELAISDVEVHSPSGAPDDVELEKNDTGLGIVVGDEDQDDISGVQQYVISYHVSGIPESDVDPGDGVEGSDPVDEIYWNVIGNSFEVPIEDIEVTLAAPQQSTAQRCFVGDVGSQDACAVATEAAGATFSHDHLDVGEGMSVVAAYPLGTFGGAQPHLIPRATVSNRLGLTVPIIAISAVLLIAAVTTILASARRRGRDEVYAGTIPGVVPPTTDQQSQQNQPAQAARQPRITTSTGRRPIAVQFAPPQGIRAGELGALLDEGPRPGHLTATIIDLAVRGYMRVLEHPDPDKPDTKDPTWQLEQLREPDAHLADYEHELLTGLFADGAIMDLDDPPKEYQEKRDEATEKLRSRLVTHGWYRKKPRDARAPWILGGTLVAVLGVGLGIGLSFLGVGLLAVPVLGAGIALIIGSAWAPVRTPRGSAMRVQGEGFKQYIATAEAEQIQFDASQDIFSRYLPYAMVFGLADRWAEIFQTLHEQGAAVPEPGWYLGGTAGGFYAHGAIFSSGITSFTQATENLASAGTVSGGGSGFSGGVGGGVGGGGGGGW